MNIKITRPLMIAGILLLAGCATGRPMVFIVGDDAYVNGQKMPLKQYQEMKENGTLEQFTNQRGSWLPYGNKTAAAPAPGAVPGAVASAPVPAGAVRTATCRTTHLFDEFPSDDEKFSCTSGLGELTRAQIVNQGWHIDLTEKLPAPGNALSPRGMPLASYKLVISR